MSDLPNTITAMRAGDFVDTIGVNVHLGYWNTPYGNAFNVVKDLSYLGIDHVRDAIPFSFSESSYEPLLNAGIKFDLIFPDVGGFVDLAGDVGMVTAMIVAHPSDITAVEGPNEVNYSPIFFDGSWSMQAQGWLQQAIYAAVRADSALAGVSVYSLTLGGVGADAYAPLGNLSASVNDGNAHIYFANGSPPDPTLQTVSPWIWSDTPTSPRVVTETGYYTLLSGYGVDQATQAKYELDLLMDNAKAGIKTTFIYELLDEFSDPASNEPQAHYGLFNYDGTPKPAAIAIHNLTAILSDPANNAATFTTSTLNYTVTGLPSTGSSLLMQKASGAFDITVWNEPALWNQPTQTPVTANVVTTVVQLGASYSSVEVYDPLVGTTPVQILTNVSQVTLALTDHPLIIEVAPTLTPFFPISTGTTAALLVAPTVTPTFPIPPAVAATTDTLVLNLAEDAWLGDAQFIVRIDGTQFGGAQTVTAIHGLAAKQDFTVTGNLGVGPHTVAVTFLNDAYGGTPTTDRNLWINALTLDGQRTDLNYIQATTGTAYFTLQTPGTTTDLGAQNTIFTSLGNDTVEGGSGTDAIAFSGPAGLFVGGTGQDAIALGAGADTIQANAATLQVQGGPGSLDFLGGSGSATVAGGSGNATISGGTGNLQVVAGSGAETFQITHSTAPGALTISGFQSSLDKISLAGYGAAEAQKAIAGAQSSGTGTLLSLSDGTTIMLQGLGSASSTMFR